MKSANHLFAASGRRLSAPKGVVLGLALTSLLSGGLTLALSSAASAAGVEWTGGEISQAAQNQTIRSRRLPRAIALAVLQDAASRSGQPINSIRIIQATPKTFGNPCAFNFGDRCTYEYNPVQGWEVVVRVRGQAWTYHVDRTASQVVLDPKVSSGNTSELPASVQSAVLNDAARRSGLPINSLQIIEATSKTFSYPCELSFGGPSCALVYNPVPGWEVVVQVGQRSWLYRSDRTGSRIALNPTIASNPGDIPGAYIDAVIMDAVRRANVTPATLRILETKAMTFGNPCIFNFGEVCTREYRPIEGYEIMLQVKGQTWRYHVDKTGSQVVLDPRIAGNTGVLPSEIETAVLQNAIAWTNRPVKIVEAKSQTWGNSCEFGFGRVCPMIYQPVEGWQVSVQADQLTWTYHVSRDGTNLLMDRRNVLTARVADAIAQDIIQRSGSSVGLNSLRFLEVKEEPQQVCSLFGGCRTVSTWLTIVSNGRQQWGYQSDEQGNRVEPISVARVRQALERTANK